MYGELCLKSDKLSHKISTKSSLKQKINSFVKSLFHIKIFLT